MTEERQPDSTADTTGTTGDAVVSSGGQTVEEVEAFWRNRQSGNDRSHNAETAALRAQIEALKAPAPVQNETPEAAKVRELEAALQVERNTAKAATLRAEYPQAAGVLGDAIVGLPLEKIAALEARIDSGDAPPAPRMDPNAAPRPSTGSPGTGVTPTNQKSKDELLADLARIAPAYQEAAKEGLL